MKRILEIIYKSALALFEFLIDLLIIFVIVVIIKGMFENNIYVDAIILLITFCGLVYGIHDFVEVYKENKFKK